MYRRQEHYRRQHQRAPLPAQAVCADGTRQRLDQDLLSCLKYFVNFFFYKFGLEVSSGSALPLPGRLCLWGLLSTVPLGHPELPGVCSWGIAPRPSQALRVQGGPPQCPGRQGRPEMRLGSAALPGRAVSQEPGLLPQCVLAAPWPQGRGAGLSVPRATGVGLVQAKEASPQAESTPVPTAPRSAS